MGSSCASISSDSCLSLSLSLSLFLFDYYVMQKYVDLCVCSFKSPESAASSRAEASQTSPSTSGSRKREHKPDRQVSNKRHAAPASDD